MKTLFTQRHLLQLQEYSDHIKSRVPEYFIGFSYLFSKTTWLVGQLRNQLKFWNISWIHSKRILSWWPIIWEKLVHSQTDPKWNRSFTWLGEIVNASISKTLNYMTPNWLRIKCASYLKTFPNIKYFKKDP